MKKEKRSGFTLLEFMSVIAILGILLSIAYPAYNQHTTKVRRQTAQARLLQLANNLEEYFSEHHTYATATLGVGNPETDIAGNSLNEDGSYQFKIVKQEPNAYLIAAFPQGKQASDDRDCGALSLDNRGNKNSEKDVSGKQCW